MYTYSGHIPNIRKIVRSIAPILTLTKILEPPMLKPFLSVVFIATISTSPAANANDTQMLRDLSVAPHRSASNIVRNESRHPVETLEFFGLTSDMTAIEILPGGGWYTEILAPFLKDSGTYYGAHFSPNAPLSYQPPMLAQFNAKLSQNPEMYGKAIVTHLNPPTETDIAPEASADIAMTFRNVHNWIMAGNEEEYFAAFYKSLKPGGILGVVEHRAPAGSSMQIMENTGYVTQDYVIELATQAGFEFVASSEINANPLDTKDYRQGVWTLPPTLRLGETDKAKYMAIGESDRMTLKFQKPQ